MPDHPLEVMTPRLRLRALSPEESWLALERDQATLSARIGASVPTTWPSAELAEGLPGIVARMEEQPADADGWLWTVIDPARAAMVGDIGFHSPVRGMTSVEIGYLIFPDARGRGYATEAAEALIAWAFTQPGIQRVTAQIDPANARSLRVAEKLGLRETEHVDERYLCFEQLKPSAPSKAWTS